MHGGSLEEDLTLFLGEFESQHGLVFVEQIKASAFYFLLFIKYFVLNKNFIGA